MATTLDDMFFRTLQHSENNSIKNTEGARLDVLLDKSEVCSPSTTPRIQKSIEEYDITAKLLQNRTYILKKKFKFTQ
jgi:hypothetical protein